VVRRSRTGSFYYYAIGNIRLTVSRKAWETMKGGARYRVYYVPGNFHVLSLEPEVTSRIGHPRYIPRGHDGVSRVLGGGLVVSASGNGIFEWELATRRLRSETPLTAGSTARSISLTGDVFFTEAKALHAFRRATRKVVRLCPVTDTLSVSADGASSLRSRSRWPSPPTVGCTPATTT
jgi:hypothetical protein